MENFSRKKIIYVCEECKEIPYIQILNKSKKTDTINIKYRCNTSHKSHIIPLNDYLKKNIKEESYFHAKSSRMYFRNGVNMKLSEKELNEITSKYNSLKNEIFTKNKEYYDKINSLIDKDNTKNNFTNKLREKLDKSFSDNNTINKQLNILIDAIINTYNLIICKYPMETIICTFRDHLNFEKYKFPEINENKENQSNLNRIILEAIKYFSDDYIIKINGIDLDLKPSLKTSIELKSNIQYMRYLSDKEHLLLGTENGEIIIINTDNYKIDNNINENSNDGSYCTFYIQELKNKNIISLTARPSIMYLWEPIISDNKLNLILLNKFKNQESALTKVIELENLNLLTSSIKGFLILWKKDTLNNYKIIQKIQAHERLIIEICLANKNILLSCAIDYEENLKIWNLNGLKCEKIIPHSSSGFSDSILKINEDLFLIGGGLKFVLVFRLSSREIIRNIMINYIEECIDKTMQESNDRYFKSLIELSDGNVLVDGGENNLKVIDMNNYHVNCVLLIKDVTQIQKILKLNKNRIVLSFRKSKENIINFYDY